MTRLDRAIAALSPSWGARRAAARVSLRQVERIGTGMRTRRRPDEWRINDPATRRSEAAQGKPLSRYDRARIREIFDLNPFAAKVKEALLNNLIGYGITGTIKGTKAASTAWKDWISVCDYDGVLDLYGLQELVADIWLTDGEVFIVKRIVPGAKVHPLRLQVLDADQLDMTAAVANTRIRDGVEYDGEGKPAAYHFKRSREIDRYGDPVRVPAEHVIHVFRRKRAGQWRGRSHFEPVLDVLGDVDDYLEAEGIRKKIEACFVGFREQSIEADDPTMGELQTDGLQPGEPPEESFYPGMIINGRPGEKMTFGDPKANGGLAEFMRWGGLRMAAGASTTYEHATGDLSNVNYTSHRAGGLEFHRFIARVQWLLLIPRFLAKVADAWVEAGFASGVVTRAPTFKWTPPPVGSVDPEKDIKAKRAEMEAGAESLRNVVGERGYDLDELSDEIAADIKMLESKGLLALVAAMFGKPAQAKGQTDASQAA